MVMSVWWPQVVLFDQRPALQIKNALFFPLFHLDRVLISSVLQLAWWLILFLFLPWTGFVVPFLGIWYILFVAMFFLYKPMNESFHIEEQIEAKYPGRLEK